MKKILVLGAGGFIGGNLMKHFIESGDPVVGVDIKPHTYLKHDIILGDLRDIDFVEDVLRAGYDEVYQLASDVGGAGYIGTGSHDADIMSNSAIININIAKIATKIGVGKLFFASSSCVYPAIDDVKWSESGAYPAICDGEYGWEKLFSERVYSTFHRNYGLNIRIGRFQNVFGPYETIGTDRERFFAAICRKIIASQSEVEIWGSGEQKRSFVYIDDCIHSMLELMATGYHEPVNIGVDDPISINDLAAIIISMSGKSLKIRNITGMEFLDKYGFYLPSGVKDKGCLNDLYYELTKARYNKLSYSGIHITYKWIKQQLS